MEGLDQIKEGVPMWGQPVQRSQSPSGPGWFGVLKPELGKEGGMSSRFSIYVYSNLA